MSKLGFIQLPRSFYDDPIWKSFSLEERSIFTAIVVNAAWEQTTQDDFGVLITVKPGQVLMTQRTLIAEAFPPTDDPKILNKYKSSVVRALAKFKKLKFSYHETYHKKTLHTILRSDILDHLVPKNEPNSYQTRTLKEEGNKEIREIKKKINKEKILSINSNEDLPSKDESSTHEVAINQDFAEMQHNIQNKTNNQELKNSQPSKLEEIPKKVKSKSDSKRRKKSQVPEEEKIRFGTHVWFEKTNKSYENLCADLGKEMVHHFINLINLDLKSKGLPLDHYDDYGAAVRKWHAHAIVWGTLPKHSTSSLPSNQEYAKEVYNKFSKKIRNYSIYLGPNYLEFTPQGGNAPVFNIKFNENGFRDQVESFLRKCGVSLVA